MRFLFALFSVASFFIVRAEWKFDSIRSEQRGDLLFVIHEVEEEETLYSIARRYKSTIPSIIEYNSITGNRIEIGQTLSVLFDVAENESSVIDETPAGFHRVQPGETLYSISRQYELKIRDLRRLNQLKTNEISPGEYLRVTEVEETNEVQTEEIPDQIVASEDSLIVINGVEIPNGYEAHLVQTAETLISIAIKKGVSVEDLKEWNNLESDYIRIGQTLIVRKVADSLKIEMDSTRLTTRLNEDGFEKVYEKGIAGIISDISTTKYLALHRTMPIGTELEVRNLMNNFVVHVKVVGKLPDTGVNRNVLLRLSKPAFEQLGILDPKSRVEVSHFKK